MVSEFKNICDYYSDVLKFRDFIEIPDNIESYFYISDNEFKTGDLKLNDAKLRLLGKWAPKKRDTINKGDTIEHNDVDVVLIPKIVTDIMPKYTSPRAVNKDQAWEFKKISLMYIKAKIDKDVLQIKPRNGESIIWSDPLIRRPEPIYKRFFQKLKNIICHRKSNLGTSRFILNDATSIQCSDDDWRQYIAGVDKHFEQRTGYRLFHCDVLTDDQGKDHNLYEEDRLGQIAVLKDDTVLASHHIVSLFDRIGKEQEEKFPLLKTMLFGNGRQKKLNKFTDRELIGKHLGQMQDEYPLADAQRGAVHCINNLNIGEVLAVSGPPGTGKTSLLQSIVANMIVESVVREDAPVPLILASSTNNKAITNIIDAFNGEKDKTSTSTSTIDLYHRWLCYMSDEKESFVPLAVYCPSASVDKNKVKEYFTTDTQGGGNYGALRQHYYQDSSDFYIRARKSLNLKNNENVEDIKKTLLSLIDEKQRKLKEFGNMVNDGTLSSDDLNSINKCLKKILNAINQTKPADKISKWKACEDVRDVYMKLDMTIRYELYWLAVHYNECVWISAIEEFKKSQECEARKDKLPRVYGKFLWNEIKMICPCVVSTFFMAPRLFEYKQKNGVKTYNYGLADLLIVDEAGQVSPEIGLPTFALAKKALVVGDLKQIPPVYSIPECEEDKYWKSRILSKRMQNDRPLLSSCQSSIMALAENRSAYQREIQDGQYVSGLFLDEHRRCVDEIIAYSNELIYNGQLIPKRGKHSEKCKLKQLPPIGFFQTSGDSNTQDGSRFNRHEVTAISKWLKQNALAIEDAYENAKDGRRNIYQLVSIITPFKAQSSLLKQDDYLKNFPIGTVHTFQGAESPIVLFSLVYGSADNPVFIKNNHKLMNVALSRAKDHFLIFGNRECLAENSNDLACSLLHKKAADLGPRLN